MNSSKNQSAVDLFGAVISSLCLIHCIITPIIFVAKPVLETTGLRGEHGHTSWWGALDFVFLILSFLAVWYSAHHTPFGKIASLLWFFWVVFALGLVLEFIAIPQSKWFLYIGSISLAITHFINYQLCKACRTDKLH